MRELTVRFGGACARCGAELKIGTQAMYEKTTGIFCVGHEPHDIEEIRAFRQKKADQKADKYEAWAAKRRMDAEATFKHNEPFTSDIAFNTQPGYIPLRARIIRQEDRAFESMGIAKRMEQKAVNLRDVHVAGDAERRRQSKRDAIKPLLKVGMEVDTVIYGVCPILKINKKTVTVGGRFSPINVDISFLRIDPYGPHNVVNHSAAGSGQKEDRGAERGKDLYSENHKHEELLDSIEQDKQNSVKEHHHYHR